MSGDGYVVAILGASTDLGREVLTVLRERAFAVAQWRLYEDADVDPEAHWHSDEADDLLPAEAIDLEGVDVVFFCGAPSQTIEWAPRALTAGALAIDATHTLAEHEAAELVVPEVSAERLGEGATSLLVCPVTGATALAVVLAPLQDAAEVRRVVVTAYEPVSSVGHAGIDELAGQTRDLLAGMSVEPMVFPHRVAFNLIPQVGELVAGDRTRAEWWIESQTRRVLDLPDLPIAATCVTVPIFFGNAYAVHIETEQPLDAAAASALLRASPGILLAATPAECPTPADVIGSDAVHVGRMRDDPTVPYGVALWILLDGLRKGAAVNAVQVAELALRAR